MESLPGEMIAEIGRYLSLADVVACSATCRTWREMFNDDRIWRRRCTLRLAEYLEDTDTTVPPGLQLTEHDSLSPLCEWRIRFIRENHLWNNWRQGHFTMYHMASAHGVEANAVFYDNDYLVMLVYNEMTLWDIRGEPICLMTNPCDLDTALLVDHFEILSEDRILLVQVSYVSVYRISVTSSHWPLIHAFYFDERLSTRDFSVYDAMSPGPREDGVVSLPQSCFYTVNGDYFLGVASGYARLLHIWNISTGDKLKEVICPVSNPNSYFTNLYHSHKPSPDILVLVEEDLREEISFRAMVHLFVYDLSDMCFRAFVESRSGRVISIYKCMIYDPYVFIRDACFMSIFNYKTFTLVDIMPASSDPFIFNNNVIYSREAKYREFDVSTGETELLTDFNAYPTFFLACDRFIAQVRGDRLKFAVLEVGRIEKDRCWELCLTPRNQYWLACKVATTNAMYTKRIIIEFRADEYKHNIYLLNFW
ncbi:hypothetical protein J6590_054759 [Homalodisca vitripennis]|nr:hypothetical protein J6590_054759 [Homalodisca vitripennis]